VAARKAHLRVPIQIRYSFSGHHGRPEALGPVRTA
jgi:hypothetical protein